MSELTVSIIVPLFNKAAYIGDAVRSVKAQTWAAWELIIADNGSTDDGCAAAAEAADSDPRIKLVPAAQRRGPGFARNRGLEHATGSWVLFLDGDDLIEPDHLRQLVGVVERGEKVDIVAGGWKEFRDSAPGKVEMKRPAGFPKDIERLRTSAIAFTPWAVHAALVRRSILRSPYLWLEAMDGLLAEDSVFWFRLVLDHDVALCDSSGALYRRDVVAARTDLSPKRWFEGNHAVVCRNVEFARSSGRQLGARYCQALFDLYGELYESAERVGDGVTAIRAGAEARRWGRKALMLGKPHPSVLLCGLVGLRAFRALRRMRHRFRPRGPRSVASTRSD